MTSTDINSQHGSDKGTEMSAWRDIGTAPVDGTDILVATDYGTCDVVYFGWEDTATGKPVWFNGDVRVTATHWMPLPALPHTLTNEDRG